MTPEERLALAGEIYRAVLEESDSFDDIAGQANEGSSVGSLLAYLMGAIVLDDPDGVMLDIARGGELGFYKILRLRFPDGAPIWHFVNLEGNPRDWLDAVKE